MCDDCGCDNPKNGTPDDEARHVRQKDGGWHVHADGTVHSHDHHHGHSHQYAPSPAFRGAAKQRLPKPEPELEGGKDNGADGTSDENPLSSNASTG